MVHFDRQETGRRQAGVYMIPEKPNQLRLFGMLLLPPGVGKAI